MAATFVSRLVIIGFLLPSSWGVRNKYEEQLLSTDDLIIIYGVEFVKKRAEEAATWEAATREAAIRENVNESEETSMESSDEEDQ